MTHLKDCPFCGGGAVIVKLAGFRVRCARCGAESPMFCDWDEEKLGTAEAKAVKAWNRRSYEWDEWSEEEDE